MSLSIRRAVEQDIAEVTYCVCKAFIHYIPRIGKQPGPMLDDYRSIYLSTNCLMYESQLIYAHVGYIEYDRRNVSGYDRIFLRKQLV